MSRLSVIGLALTILLSGANGLNAHTFLERSEPQVGSTVRSSPSEVKLWFTQSLEPAFSTLQVVNEAGERVDKGDGHVDPLNPAVLQISLTPLSPGTYKVIWHVLSVDGHVAQGDFIFQVAP